MKKGNRRRNNRINIKLIIYSFILALLTLSNVFLIVNLIKLKDIETLIKSIVIAIIVIINILFIIKYIFTFFIKKTQKITISLIIMIIMLALGTFLNYTFEKVYNMFNDISKNYEEYTLTLVTLSNIDVEHIGQVDDKIGVIADETIENGYKYAKEIVEKNKVKEELVKYETYLNIVDALYTGELKYAFLPSNYVSMFFQDENYADIEQKLKVIHSDSKKVEVEVVNQEVNKPFTILLMGVDTLNSSYNADTLLLVTFNPDTLGATMLSIPRDTYTKIACTGGKHKINSSGWYSDKCVVNTVSNLVDVDIDYYIKINFVGIVNLVEALGGIDVDVPYAFCEQNSSRQFGENMVYVEEGFQHLNGEQALALSRNRKFLKGQCPAKYNEKGYYSTNTRNDITRGLNQQLVLKGILNSLTNVRDLNTVYELLDVVSANISTNMSKDTMLSFYNIFKNIVTTSDLSNIENTLDIQKLALTVYGTRINISGMNLSMIIAHQNSINAVSNAMKENLGQKNKDVIKTFNFNINSPYEETTIGSGIYGGTTLNLLSNLVGRTKDEATSYCSSIGKTCEFEYTEITDGSYSNNQIISQSIPANYDISLIYRPIVFNVAKVVNTKPEGTTPSSFDYSKCITEEYKDNSKCQIPNFTNKTISEFNSWYRNFGFITAEINKITDETKTNNIIISQNIFGKSIYELYSSNGKIKIDYIFNETKEEEKPPVEEPGTNEGTGGENTEGSGDNSSNQNNPPEEPKEENGSTPPAGNENNNNETPTNEEDDKKNTEE